MHEIEIFEAPVWFEIGPCRFQFTSNIVIPFDVSFIQDTGIPVPEVITHEEFFRAAKVWEYLEVLGLENDFLDRKWLKWVRKFPQPIVAGFITPRTLMEFFQRCKFYQLREEHEL